MKKSTLSTSIALALATTGMVYAGEGGAAEQRIALGISGGFYSYIHTALLSQPGAGGTGYLFPARGVTSITNGLLTVDQNVSASTALITVDAASLGDCVLTGWSGSERYLSFDNQLTQAYVDSDGYLVLQLDLADRFIPAYQGLFTLDCEPPTEPAYDRTVSFQMFDREPIYSAVVSWNDGRTSASVHVKGPNDAAGTPTLSMSILDWNVETYYHHGCSAAELIDAPDIVWEDNGAGRLNISGVVGPVEIGLIGCD